MATDIEQVRGLIGDDETPFTFTDDQIQLYLDTYEGNVFRAAGNLLLRAAVDVGLASKMVRTDDLTVDDTKRGSILLERAKIMLTQADDADNSASGLIISFFPTGPHQANIEGVPSWGY